MSGALGIIPYPQAEEQPGPLDKYTKQLPKLAQVTANLPPPVDPMMGQRMAQMGQQAMTPGVMTPPQAPIPMAPPAAPPPSAMLQAAAPAMAPRPAPPPDQGPPPGPADVTQFRQDPTTGGLVGRRPPPQAMAGSQALQQAAPPPGGGPDAGPGAEPTPGAGPDAEPGPFTAPPATPGKWTPQSREEDRINTALASEKAGRNPHAGNDKQVGLEMAKAATGRPGQPSYLDRAAATIRQHFDGQIDFKGATTPDQIAERFVNHMRDNLLDVWNRVPEAWKGRAKLWYQGANKIAHDWANDYGYHPRQMAGVMAALSPATDWFQNVALAKRVIEYVRDKQNVRTTPEMMAAAQRFVDQKQQAGPKAEWQRHVDGFRNADGSFKTFGQLGDDAQRALWIRIYDDNHPDASRNYHAVTPEGDFAHLMRNKPKNKAQRESGEGDPAASSFLYTDGIEKALKILRDGSRENISRNLGGAHKVRSFYNNIIAHMSRSGDVTGDTHAIAAALLQPLGQKSDSVGLGLGNMGPSSAEGLHGLYPFVAEAYRRAARKVSTKATPVLPREFQSVTWEGIRGIFSAAFKRQAGVPENNLALWRRHTEGKASAPQTRNKIYEAAGAPLNRSTGQREARAPAWHTGEASVEE